MNLEPKNIWRINILWVVAGGLAYLFLVRLTQATESLYFTFAPIVLEYAEFSWLSMLVRFLIPVLIGFVMTVIDRQLGLETYLAGLLGSFLIVWPAVYLSRYIYLYEGGNYQQQLLYLVYLVIVLSMTFLAGAGGALGKLVRIDSRSWQAIGQLFNWKTVLQPLIIGIVGSILASYIMNQMPTY